jgi:serine/threonine protein kinase
MAQQYGDWLVVESLGEGGQAHSYRVTRSGSSDDGYVLKRLKNAARLPRFRQEVDALKTLSHERVPQLVDFKLDGDSPWLVYTYVDGMTLDKAVHDLSVDEGLDLCRDVTEAVAAAHAVGIVHRDIKPNNVIVTGDAPHRRACLIDFGICQSVDGKLQLTTTGEGLGNWAFAAPEAWPGSELETSEKSDVYSLGALLYYSVTGGVIVGPNLTPTKIERIPSPRFVERSYIRQLLEMCLSPDPSRRCSADDLRRRMERFGGLMRTPVNRMGARDQLCFVCREGSLRRVTDPHIAGLMGFSFKNDERDYRLLHCDYCGYVQGHFIKDTRGLGEWEL